MLPDVGLGSLLDKRDFAVVLQTVFSKLEQLCFRLIRNSGVPCSCVWRGSR